MVLLRVFTVSLVFCLGNLHFTTGQVNQRSSRTGAQLDASVRLVDGSTPWEGRVEILHAGRWGTICDDLWDLVDGHVVCMSLGYASSVAALREGYFGPGTGDILLDGVECIGNESSILNCPHGGVGNHDCQHNEDAGVKCSISAVRLAEGRYPWEGRVEVFHVGSWGTVCSDNWDIDDGNVVCRSLGLGEAAEVTAVMDYTYGFDDIFLDEVQCLGNESILMDCPHAGLGVHNCNHSQDASVKCETGVRLVGGKNSLQGRVEVFYDGAWGTICSHHWDINDAHVVCRSLGLTYALSAPSYGKFGEGTGDILLDGLQCLGGEPNILDCDNDDTFLYKCFHRMDAGVTCSPDDYAVFLVNGTTYLEGTVKVAYRGYLGSLCDTSWDLNNADVICKNLGYGHAIGVQNFGQGTDDVILDDIHCVGNETTIFDCSHSGLGVHNCNHSQDAGVICFGEDVCITGLCETMENVNDTGICIPAVHDCFLEPTWGLFCMPPRPSTHESAAVVCMDLEDYSLENITRQVILDRQKNVKNLYLNNTFIKMLSGGVFSGLKELEWLDLNDNNITTIYPDTFSGLSNLLYLYLRKNNLGHIPDGAFADLGGLVWLELNEAGIETLSPSAFDGLKSLQHLTLDGNMIETLPVNIFSGTESLNYLYMQENQIRFISDGLFSTMFLLFYLDLHQNQLEVITDGTFLGLPYLFYLDLSDNRIEVISTGAFAGLSLLDQLDLRNNRIMTLPDIIFNDLQSLFYLYLQDNQIEGIPKGAFSALETLTTLFLQNNNITQIPDGAFQNLPRLNTLNMSSNAITHLQSDAFQGQENLEYLDLGYNQIRSLEGGVFANLSNLNYLFLLDLQVDHIPIDIMSGLTNLKAISTSDNRLCCLLSNAENTTCARTSPPSPLDTCGSLYPSYVLRIAGWVIGLSSLVGNVIVVILRASQKKYATVQNILTMNLAVADSLMGVYMVIITSADVYFNRLYFLSAPLWRGSFPCQFSSFLAFFSSELSVLTLTLITLDRYITIVYTFGKYHMTPKSAILSLMFVWIFTFIFSSVPFIVGTNLSGFYGLSDVCIGLPLHVELGDTGRLEVIWDQVSSSEFRVEYVITDFNDRQFWVFSIVTFIGINMALFIFILACYISMFVAVKRSSESTQNSAHRKREIRVARKMAFIVGTDFACWMPIIVMGILTQAGVVVLPTSLYAWSVIFIIPINSSINPVLYTFINYIDAQNNKGIKKNSHKTLSTRLSKEGSLPRRTRSSSSGTKFSDQEIPNRKNPEILMCMTESKSKGEREKPIIS